MTEKRFRYMEQFNGFCDVYDRGKILSCMRLEYVDKTVNLLNELHEEKEDLSTKKEDAEYELLHLKEKYEELLEENEQLKKELEKFKEWEKHIRDVRREDLDRVFKMSIYEIAEAFDYYKERIKKLEKELQK